MNRSHSYSKRAFTLIELLVVIAIIIVLVSLLIPIVHKAKQNAKVTKARREISHLEAALREYMSEYRRPHGNIVAYGNWPASDTDVENTINGIQVEKQVVALLSGVDVDGDNPKRIPFYETASASTNSAGQFVDPWEQPYKYMLDYNRDGQIEVNFTSFDGQTNLRQKVAVWSRGADGDDQLSTGGWDDDVRNW
jgi:prepilin-type N-terminal cleavage/methylation domain-containing protein